MISTVHVVFKTHLDLGFTDTAARVTARYVHEYLPRAIALAEELERRERRRPVHLDDGVVADPRSAPPRQRRRARALERRSAPGTCAGTACR